MIRIGYEIGTGKAVDVPADHTAVIGRTQQSGKTTTLEAMVHRSGLRAVAFVTKRAEASFRDAQSIPPYFRERADWEFVSSILEAMLGERMKFERSWIIDACRDASTLTDVHQNIQRGIHGVAMNYDKRGNVTKWRKRPATGLNAGVLTNLDAYLEKVIPQLQKLPYTKELKLPAEKLSVMDLSAYSTELQSLVIRSVLEWVYQHERNTVVIVPEAWEFIPQNRRSPVLLAAEELIRKGAAAGNLVWLDSQDIAAVHKNVLRSVGVWILGVQTEAHEIDRAIAHMPAPRPKPDDVMRLGRGQFFVNCKDASGTLRLRKVYVQPFWIDGPHAQGVAMGEESLESVESIWREKQKKQPGRDRPSFRHQNPPEPRLRQIQDQESPDADTIGVPSDSHEERHRSGVVHPSPTDERTPTQSNVSVSIEEAGFSGKRTRPTERTSSEIPSGQEPRMAAWKGKSNAESEETVWKEKYETLERQFSEASCAAAVEIDELKGIIVDLVEGRHPDLSDVDIHPKTGFEVPDGIRAQTQLDVLRRAVNDAGFTIIYDQKGVSLRPIQPPTGLSGAELKVEQVALNSENLPQVVAWLKQQPEVIELFRTTPPRLIVHQRRKNITLAEDHIHSKIGTLVEEGFFDRPRPLEEVAIECKRRGFIAPTTKNAGFLSPRFKELVEMGLLTMEAGGYRKAPGIVIEYAREARTNRIGQSREIVRRGILHS